MEFDLWLLRLSHEELAAYLGGPGGETDPRRLTTELAGLPDAHREALALRFLFGRGRAETAPALDAAMPTVSEWTRLGLEDLAEAA